MNGGKNGRKSNKTSGRKKMCIHIFYNDDNNDMCVEINPKNLEDNFEFPVR